jgi:hypothetical protein
LLTCDPVPVASNEFVKKDVPRPPVVYQVVLDMYEHKVVVGQSHQLPSEQWNLIDRDSFHEDVLGESGEDGVWVIGIPKIGYWQSDRGCGLDDLLPS